MDQPKLFEISTIGEPSNGYISVIEGIKDIPFEIKRVYWTYFTPNHVQRGSHSHKALQQLIVAVSGIIEFTLIDKSQNKKTFLLDNPNKVLYIPPGYWRNIQFSHNAVLLCLASLEYDEGDYIRDFNEFLNQ